MPHALEAPFALLQRVYASVFGVRDGWLEHASDASRIASLAIFLGVAGGLALLICERSLRGRAVAAFAGMAGLVLAFCLMTGGLEDVQIHIHRVAAFAGQLREGMPGLMLVDPVSGEGLPVFVFYSPLPYVLPILLDLAGLPAMFAYRLSLAAYFCLFALGLYRLTLAQARAADAAAAREPSFLAASLFLGCAYIAGIWAVRSAFAEIVVLCLVPWAVLLLREGGRWRLACILAAQMASHPIVFPQAFLATILLGLGLSDRPPLALLRRLVLPTIGALALSSPFWAPQVLWEPAIGGAAATPFQFRDSFFSWRGMLHPVDHHNLGPWFLLALLALLVQVVRHRRATGWRGAMLGLAFAASIAMQLEILRPLTLSLPFLERGQFIWRMMSLAALLGFGALLLGWRDIPRRTFRLLCCATAANLVVMVALLGGHKAALILAFAPDQAYRTDYPSYNTPAFHLGFGFSEFYPNYAALPETCPAIGAAPPEPVSYAAARGGVVVHGPILAMPRGPLRFVSYRLDDRPLLPAGRCGDDLVFGPLDGAGRFLVDEGRIALLFWVRLVVGFAIIAGAALAIGAGPRRSPGRDAMASPGA
ncbi:hypothetical protein [Roseicella frigidaeris]|uniref:Uncharacterized protein n=1 Tax=Roseicella frigidaeris TaxID=2230885 RepID=A0A327MAE8_9PROT|nr:hypothetical protein [Roseicella frigidaeris]RAI59900.1 hypothetical protein DOO78_06545 [Roseicella frigidaeris]